MTRLSSALVPLLLLLCFPLHAQASEPVYDSEFGSPGTNPGEFDLPFALATDDSSNVYVTDFTGNRVQKFQADGTFAKQWGGTGSGTGQFDSILGIAVSSDGFVYVSDVNNSRVQKFDRNGIYISDWPVDQPNGIAVHPTNGNVYLYNNDSGKMEVFNSNGVFQFEFGSQGTGPGQFNWGHSVALDVLGNVYVSDNVNHRISKWTELGVLQAEWGAEGNGFGKFQSPTGISTDAHQNVYVADIVQDRVQVFDSNGTFLLAFGSTGSGPGEMVSPVGISVAENGKIYVMDQANDRVEIFSDGDFYPVVQVTAPDPFSLVEPSGEVEITWIADDDNEVTLVDLYYIEDVKLYGTTSGSRENSVLYEIDPTDGSGVMIGFVGYDRVGAIAFDPLSGELTAAAERTSDAEGVLIKIYTDTGAGYEVGITDIFPHPRPTSITDITFLNAGTRLVGHKAQSGGFNITTMWEFDKVGGSAVMIDSTDVFGAGGGLERTLNDRLLLALSLDADRWLYEVNPITGVATTPIPVFYPPPYATTPRIKAMAVHPNTGLIYVIFRDDTDAESFGILNVATGVVSTIGTTVEALDGLAFGPGTCIEIATGEANDGSYLWAVPKISTNYARIKIVVHDETDNIDTDMTDWHFSIAPSLDASGSQALAGIQLSPPAPNPFQSNTTIRFSLSVSEPVNLSIYDARGRRVADLVDKTLPAGAHQLTWNGRDRSGSRAPAGFYLVRLSTARGELTRELVLTR